jgi:hypothetical protein
MGTYSVNSLKPFNVLSYLAPYIDLGRTSMIKIPMQALGESVNDHLYSGHRWPW